ncbi:MAG: gfo/Idh/MocA family oxidoreductase [Actinobacteria bacterium]|nr:gfo/Idh/MocA family oxidoreductase [Actinomycetota bacterium]
MSPQTLRLGLIGLGRAAVSILPSIISHPHVRITAAADRESSVRDRFGTDFDVPTYADAEELVADSEVDAVYISTPHQLHASQTILAAQNKKHVLVEKPMALSLEDCESMRQAAADHGVQIVVGHTHAFDRPIRAMRAIIAGGELGQLAMINTWNFTSFLWRPRRPEELDTRRGGGIIFNQVPHQIDMVRLIGGGLVTSVRSMTWVLEPSRPTEGSHATFLQFQDGVAATVVYSGYDFFDTDEFHGWIDEEGQRKTENENGRARRALKTAGSNGEARLKDQGGYRRYPSANVGASQQPHFGILIASCEKGDIRVASTGLAVYDEHGMSDVPVDPPVAHPDKTSVIDEFYRSATTGRAAVHDGAWGEATLEVCLAILESAKDGREIPLSRQVKVRDSEGMSSTGPVSATEGRRG